MSTRILIIEDSPTEALLARLVLEREGYQVILANDGQDGLAKATTERPEIILLDTVMPRVSGYEIWEKLRADSRTRTIPVVLLSTQQDFTEPCFLKADSLVSKPCQPARLVDMVKELVSSYSGLQCAESRMSQCVQVLGVGTVILKEGQITYIDEGAEMLLGMERTHLVGKPFAAQFIKDQTSFASFISQVESEGSAQAQFQVHLNGSGDERLWQVVGTQMEVAGQAAILLACRDLTEQVRANERSKRLESELQQVKAELCKAKMVKSNFLATMSHELRTPLHECLGMVDLALGTDLSPEQRQYLETAKKAAQALLAIVNDIIEFTELEAGQIGLEEVEFDLKSTIEGILSLMSSQAQEKGLVISYELAPDVPTALIGDPKRLRQVLMNLLGNAIKFTERGEVGVSLCLEHSTPMEVELHFQVCDTGIGIPEDKLELIFDVFQQADDSTTRRYGGIGLGLTMSKRLVQLMGGRIWAESKVGKGSIFHFTAKLKRQQVLEVRDLVTEDDQMPCLRILLAEDSPTNQLIAVANLKKAGHTVQVVNNGREAVKAWKSGDFDLVLMDVAMPEMDGLEATQAIRQQERETGGHIPIIAMTAFALKEYQDKCRAAGMDGYVTKPVTPDELRRAIAPFLARRREQAIETKPALPPVQLKEALEVVGGDVDLLKDVVSMSLEECPEQVQALKAAVEGQDAAGVERSAHRLKGIMGNVGGMVAREVAQRLEEMGSKGDLAQGPMVLKRFIEEFERVMAFYSQPGWEACLLESGG